ncbi:hypothetical protein Pst134EA_028828 [Puccinia striiformis f. sp. tritici]|uniref:hypothetical protein n=1 Tax=Puccinia striiformis f. sp. tritici TaxID=168172 RepID=UPI002008C3C6|nr:hypothetical protein Pst134EA_028828 [Puccinia striiformis f. sp. tritici]KAH9446842.1 hypothetical protein Pst134EA_028828 [Puccinia striiformis f. sp. tritici]
MPTQNHPLSPLSHALSTSPNRHMFPVMLISNADNTSISSSASSVTSNPANTPNTPTLSTEALGVIIGGFMIVIVLCIVTPVLVVRLRRRRACDAIDWEYPALKSIDAVLPVSQSHRSDLSTKVAVTEVELSRSAGFKTKMKSLLQKKRPCQDTGGESIDLSPVDNIKNAELGYVVKSESKTKAHQGCRTPASRYVSIYARPKCPRGSSSLGLINHDSGRRTDIRHLSVESCFQSRS